MLSIDPGEYAAAHRREFMVEAERQRLIAQLPIRESGVRHELAVACLRLASWLDAEPSRYVQPVDLGPEHWVAPTANV